MRRVLILTWLVLPLTNELSGAETSAAAFESGRLDPGTVVRVFTPLAQSLSHQRIDLMMEWLTKHSIAVPEERDRLVATLFSPKYETALLRYGKPQRVRVVGNHLVGGRFGRAVLLFEFERLFMLMRVDYLLMSPDTISLKQYSTDEDEDFTRLFTGEFDLNGPELSFSPPPEAGVTTGANNF